MQHCNNSLHRFNDLGLLPSINLGDKGALAKTPVLLASDIGSGVKFPYSLEMAHGLSGRSFGGVGYDVGTAAIIANLRLSLDLVAFGVVFSLLL